MRVSAPAALARRLSELLGLTEAPVAVIFDAAPGADAAEPVPAQPAGCCFWALAQQRRRDTIAADHAHCSVGSYTHGLISLEQAAACSDTAALVGSGWGGGGAPVGPPRGAPPPPPALMPLHSAVPDLPLARKPQCVIVPLAHSGQVAVSPGCAVSRTRTSLPD